MKLTRYQLKKFILRELFDVNSSHIYPFKIDFSSAVKSGEMPAAAEHRILHQTVRYEFDASGIEYNVGFQLHTIDNSMPDAEEPMHPDHYFWEISFDSNVEGWHSMEMTNKHDGRVLPTIIAIVIDFVKNVLPSIEDREVTSMGFEGIEETGRERVSSTRTKRTRVYILMIKRAARQLGLDVEILTRQTDDNSILFKFN